MLELLYFTATWCNPCKFTEPIVKKLAQDNNIKLTKIDVDKDTELTTKYKILSVPTLIFLKDNKILDIIVGKTTKSRIENKIDKYNGKKET